MTNGKRDSAIGVHVMVLTTAPSMLQIFGTCRDGRTRLSSVYMSLYC